MVLLLAVCHLIARSLSPYCSQSVTLLLAVAPPAGTGVVKLPSCAARRSQGGYCSQSPPAGTGVDWLPSCEVIARSLSPYCSQSVTLLLAVCHLIARSLSPYCSQSVTLSRWTKIFTHSERWLNCVVGGAHPTSKPTV